jgi:hypothetical protein
MGTSSMRIPQEVLTQIKSIQSLIVSKELEVAALKTHMSHIILRETGVDVEVGDWELDLDAGELIPHQELDYQAATEK